MKYNKILFVLCAVAISSVLSAQKCVNPNFPSQRLNYLDLGYPSATEIPADNTPISSLICHANGGIYGATSGHQSFLFHFDAQTNKVYPLGQIASEPGVHHSIVETYDGQLLIGTGLNQLQLLALTRDFVHGRRAIENQLWADIKAHYANYVGGHLYLYNPSQSDANVYMPEDQCPLVDLGIAVPNNSVYALAINPTKDMAYGISYPDAILFSCDLRTRKVKQLGNWLQTTCYSGPERSWRSVPRALWIAADGRVYSSGDNGLIYYYDPTTCSIQPTSMRLPGEYWETQNYNGYPVIEQLVAQDDKIVWGSASDGHIVRMDIQTMHIANMGKPRVERRVRAMSMGQDGRLYIICGDKDNVCRLFSFNTQSPLEGFLDYGVLGVDHSPYYAKIGYQFDAMCTAYDGTIFIGESDRRAKLFYFIPVAPIVKGALNPTNPR